MSKTFYSGSLTMDIDRFLAAEDEAETSAPLCACCGEPIVCGDIIQLDGDTYCEECFRVAFGGEGAE